MAVPLGIESMEEAFHDTVLYTLLLTCILNDSMW